MTREEFFLDILSLRGIDQREYACSDCGGLGVKSYGSTATWHGVIGGQAFTSDVCDKCWGSGNKHRPWPSHRLLKPTPPPLPSNATTEGGE